MFKRTVYICIYWIWYLSLEYNVLIIATKALVEESVLLTFLNSQIKCNLSIFSKTKAILHSAYGEIKRSAMPGKYDLQFFLL